MAFESVRSEGSVAPRLVFTFECRPYRPYTHAKLYQLKSDVRFELQLLGTATLREVVENVLHYGTRVILDAPITREALAYVDDHTRSRYVELMLDFRGSLKATTQAPAPSGAVETDDWKELSVRSGQNTIRVSRDEWLGGVVEPLGGPSHVLLDLPLPQPPQREGWQAALDHLRQAERFYRDGNDAEVLQRCYAAIGALQGAPQNILDSMVDPDPDKRAKVDKALQSFRGFLQSGRHVNTSGSWEGAFAVDRRDADFALSQTKLWLAYIARLLADGK
jgi:hypothetical protein